MNWAGDILVAVVVVVVVVPANIVAALAAVGVSILEIGFALAVSRPKFRSAGKC